MIFIEVLGSLCSFVLLEYNLHFKIFLLKRCLCFAKSYLFCIKSFVTAFQNLHDWKLSFNLFGVNLFNFQFSKYLHIFNLFTVFM